MKRAVGDIERDHEPSCSLARWRTGAEARNTSCPSRPMVDAFDADVLIYAAARGHALGRRVRALFVGAPVEETGAAVGIGSVLLVPELLSGPIREEAHDELVALAALLGRLDLRPTYEATAELAVALGASHRLTAADAVHLATAVGAGADRFVTNNARDFPRSITEIDVTYPSDLPEPRRRR